MEGGRDGGRKGGGREGSERKRERAHMQSRERPRQSEIKREKDYTSLAVKKKVHCIEGAGARGDNSKGTCL